METEIRLMHRNRPQIRLDKARDEDKTLRHNKDKDKTRQDHHKTTTRHSTTKTRSNTTRERNKGRTKEQKMEDNKRNRCLLYTHVVGMYVLM